MTPKRTLILIALFLTFTLGSFALFISRNMTPTQTEASR